MKFELETKDNNYISFTNITNLKTSSLLYRFDSH